MEPVPDPNNSTFNAKHALIAVAAALGLGLIFDILFFGKLPGISFPIFIALTISVLMVAGLRQRRELPRTALYMIPPILFFSSMVYIRASEFLTFLNVVITLYLLGLFVSLVLRPKLAGYGFKEYLALMVEVPLGAIRKVGNTVQPLLPRRGLMSRYKELKHIVRGVLVTLPVLLLFVALFSSADLVFRGYVDELFNFSISSDLFWQLFWFLAVAVAFIGLFGLLGGRSDHSNQYNVVKPAKIRFGLVETSILFGALNALFLIFIAVQVTYLFGGASNVVGGDFTYAEYARKGFFELIAVAAISMLLIFTTERLLLREREKHDAKFKLLAGLLIAQVLIIMASAFKRLNLYESAYGFTSLRLYSYIFIIWLAVVFFVQLYKIFADRRENEFALAVFISVLALLASLNFMNADGLVARKNIDRFEKTGRLDVKYLETLSDDATTEVTSLLDVEDEKLRASVASSLYNRREALRAAKSDGWQSYNLTRSAALSALDKRSELLDRHKHVITDPSYRGPGQE